MAAQTPPKDSFFLPRLERCFNEGHKLISWKTAFEALTNPHLAKQSPNLEQFFRDEIVTRSLASSLALSEPPTSQSKNDFETRTASVNIAFSQTSALDTEQIKKDSLWLSKLANIDEVSALRIIVLEWQDRPASRLLNGYTEEELISLTQAIGNPQAVRSLPIQNLSISDKGTASVTFGSENARQFRLLCCLLSEREYLSRTNLALRVASTLRSPVVPKGRTYGVQSKHLALPWIPEVITAVDAAITKHSNVDKADASSNFAIGLVQSIQTVLEAWETGAEWASSLDNPSDFDSAFRISQLRLVLIKLQLLATVITALDHSPTALAVQTWFEFTDKFGFLELLQPESPDQVTLTEQIQGLVSLVSVQMLRLPFTITYLLQHSSTERPPPIIHDVACRSQVDYTLRQAARRASRIASPCLFAWAMIIQTLCDCVSLFSDEALSDDEIVNDKAPPINSRKALAPMPQAFVDARNTIVENVEDGLDPVEFYARTAVDECGVFSVISLLARTVQPDCGFSFGRLFELSTRTCLLEVARQALVFVGYKPEMFECVLEILNVDNDTGIVENYDDHQTSPSTDLANIFMHDNDVLVPRLLHQAYLRYPYESAPLLKLCKALVRDTRSDSDQVSIAQPLCEPSPYFTHVLPSAFSGYDLVREDENSNGIRLTQELPVIINRTWRKMSNRNVTSVTAELVEELLEKDRGEFYIPEGTTGIVISESRPFVVAWDHVHAPLRYLACLLSTACATSNRQNVFSNEVLNKESQADIISTLAKLISAQKQSTFLKLNEDQSTSKIILETASDLLDRNQDVISLVSQLFEQELSNLDQLHSSSSFFMLTSCIEFFSAVVKILPGRIWPILARSQLLDTEGAGGLLNAIVIAESNVGSYDFLRACLALFDVLQQDVLAQVAPIPIPTQTAPRRFQQEAAPAPSLPKKTMSMIIFALSRATADILQILPTWQHVGHETKTGLTMEISRIFNEILSAVYGHDDTAKPDENKCKVLAPAAKLIYDAATGSSHNGLVTTLLLCITVSSLASSHGMVRQTASPQSAACTFVGLRFLTTIINVSKLFGVTALHLEHQILRSLPLFARLFATSDLHRSAILLLLSSLVRRIGANASESSSLLGSLGTDNALSFLTQLSSLSQPLGGIEQEVRTWDLASTVVANRQQWFTSFLMTGDTPKNSLKRSVDGEVTKQTLSNPMLIVALDKLSTTQAFHNLTVLSALNFVLQAQNYRPWVTNTLRKRSGFIEKLLDYVDELSKNMSREELDEPNQTYAASLIAEIVAVYLYNMRQIGDLSTVELVSSKLRFYRDNAVALPTYNSSLHSNLMRNLQQKFQGCYLQMFKKTLGPSLFGRNFCYDLDFAAQVLSSHQSWRGSRSQGFEMELSRANSNLSLVESQLLLFAGWKSLCVELCHSFTRDESLQKQMIGVANNCLLSNIESTLPESIFEHLLQARAELAMAILQKLVAAKANEPGVRRLLFTVWDAILASGQDFETSFTGSNSSYYRTLVQILLLALQPYVYMELSSDSQFDPAERSQSAPQVNKDLEDQVVPVITEIATKVVGIGFQSLCAQLHQDASRPALSDFKLLISLFRVILNVKGISAHYAQLALRICDTAVHRYAINLFSWADRLAVKDDDPLYGDVSVSFLRELSGIPPMAEFLAAEGALAQLNTAPIMARLDESSFSGLRQIWSFGLLPIVLNILIAVGDSFAAEACAFLNAFPSQLENASSAVGSKIIPSKRNPLGGAMTLSSAAELHSLAMISVALDRFRDSPTASAAAAAGYNTELNWNRTGVREDIEGWLQGNRVQLKAKIVPSNPRELQMQRSPPFGRAADGEDGCDNRLEECVVIELRGALNYLRRTE